MQLVGIEWDEVKNEQNKRDHEGLGFELAQYVFADPERRSYHGYYNIDGEGWAKAD
ncbi:hypothetical protein FACS1894137_13050 [Spirochaetia bacterium]|nr:hypothetical protein FACS1894137_13050 [Spirochaetia bacterium]